jgi:Spy/CpxP family protein refolding chaperone
MFAVKRPLRFLIHKLDLTEEQTMVVADVISDFRIERDQADVDRRRAKKALVRAFDEDEFDDEIARDALEQQLQAQRAVSDSFLQSLQRIHAVLEPAQRTKLGFLLGSLDFEM